VTTPPNDGCDQPPSPTLLAAVRQFNAGDYFLCHETLEVLWKAETRPLRGVYQGILQIGIGLLHWQRGNPKGARLLLTSGERLLQPFPPTCLGLDLAALSAATHNLLRHLNAAGDIPPLADAWRPHLLLVGNAEAPRPNPVSSSS